MTVDFHSVKLKAHKKLVLDLGISIVAEDCLKLEKKRFRI